MTTQFRLHGIERGFRIDHPLSKLVLERRLPLHDIGFLDHLGQGVLGVQGRGYCVFGVLMSLHALPETQTISWLQAGVVESIPVPVNNARDGMDKQERCRVISPELRVQPREGKSLNRGKPGEL
jgi:hypothetical protein